MVDRGLIWEAFAADEDLTWAGYVVDGGTDLDRSLAGDPPWAGFPVGGPPRAGSAAGGFAGPGPAVSGPVWAGPQ